MKKALFLVPILGLSGGVYAVTPIEIGLFCAAALSSTCQSSPSLCENGGSSIGEPDPALSNVCKHALGGTFNSFTTEDGKVGCAVCIAAADLKGATAYQSICTKKLQGIYSDSSNPNVVSGNVGCLYGIPVQ